MLSFPFSSRLSFLISFPTFPSQSRWAERGGYQLPE